MIINYEGAAHKSVLDQENGEKMVAPLMTHEVALKS